MKQGYTDITMVLDRSGSMGHIRTDTIGGINSFIEAQQKGPGEATLTLVQFDDQYQVDYLRTPIKEVQPLTEETYIPRGNTALLDAIGKTIVTLGEQYKKMPESRRPERVIMVIQTDGEENASREYNKTTIKEMITLQQSTYKWDFIFLGANQDAFANARAMGIPAANAMSAAYDAMGTQSAYRSASNIILQSRVGGQSVGGFSQSDYDAQKR
jgi:uncharacterized protein YegL